MKKTDSKLSALRKDLLQCDKELIQILKKRFALTQKIGRLKTKNNIDLKQPDFWKKSTEKRNKWAKKVKLDPKMAEAIFSQIHEYSLKQQKGNGRKK